MRGPGQRQVLYCDVKWDALRVAYFMHNMVTFVSYLLVCVTRVAVGLQFDCEVAGMINDLSRKCGKGAILY